MMSGPFGPFAGQFVRFGDTLINKISDEVFGDGNAARSTRVVIYNHSDQDLYYVWSSFDSGGFTPGMQPERIEARTIGGYRVESHGFMTGVTGADVRFAVEPSENAPCLRIVSSNPYVGDNTYSVESGEGLTATATMSVGTTSQLEADVYPVG
jgi:hypothetical protein